MSRKWKIALGAVAGFIVGLLGGLGTSLLLAGLAALIVWAVTTPSPPDQSSALPPHAAAPRIEPPPPAQAFVDAMKNATIM